jgi:site-specific recombinase XerD
MTKRTHTTKTTIYRRHAEKCPIHGQPNNVTQCECPLWIHGKVRGKFIRQSLDTRTLSTAEARQDTLERGGDEDPTPGGPRLMGKPAPKGSETIEHAAKEFLEASQKLSSSSKELYARAVGHFSAWAAQQEITLLAQVDSSHIRRYFESHAGWKRTTAQGRLTHLRVWFNWCARTKRWIAFPPTEDRKLNQNSKRGNSPASSRLPFTPAQITQIFAAIEQLPEAERDRARALIYLLLYSGMRISDATFCERGYLTPDGNLDYYVIKTRRPISLPPELQPPAIEALQRLPKTRVYFFQPDRPGDYQEARQALREGEEFGSLMPDYETRIRETTAIVMKVLALAGIDGACHKFRDTFAINLLVGDGEKGADIYTVSKMLGHSDVKITDQHYMKLVPGYRERMSKSTRVLSYQFPQAG